MNRTSALKVLLTSLLWVVMAVQAKDNEADMVFSGTLITPPPCTINDNNRIDVDFGERVGINKVDGTHYRQPMNYQISCEKGSGGNWLLSLSLIGTATGFDKNALQTNQSDLGLRVYQNDKPFMPGSSLAISLDNKPRLEAVPVKRAGATLTEGTFEAWATLQADYQ
ncbi:fimbrial protein [Serratia fonticola]|jgi:type 1 fimbria pilin|uniref:Minor fimbrial protein prsF n=1 Tax=Serratia fonticola TaxID=47917 RepID=A0A3S4WWS9_SERFO|nr:fimbrial protein [Serratia fonticola]CAI1617711.1 Minor fimbrial protein prsF precursor [Serratia fonticola]VEI75470.1 Minor fimbrial protein prsF precursor [Serratia fonticola]